VGFTDLHCHLLWGVDDGAKTPDDSLQMARTLVSLGYSDVAPSPHARPEFATAAQAEARRQEVTELFAKNGISLNLYPGAENYLDEEFLARVEKRNSRPIGSGPYALVELPFTARVPALLDMVFKIRLGRCTPLFAHPERCMEFEQKGRAAEVVQAGGLLQLDIGALIGRYGRAAKKTAESLLDASLYAITATDLHSPVGAEEWVPRAHEALRKAVGSAVAETLLSTNPARVLRGEEI
jgi:protein-tyrosine phosphatase